VQHYLGYNLTYAETEKIFHEVDEDGSGTIDFHEFSAFFIRKMHLDHDSDEMILKDFEVYDINLTGKI
jgi:Ca2+-binding EF-hand superfamily protein